MRTTTTHKVPQIGEFTPDRFCPKCESKDLRLQYEEPKTTAQHGGEFLHYDDPDGNCLVFPEHILVQCRQCGFDYWEACADQISVESLEGSGEDE